ncbi:hypothetical protein HK096_000086, partial [Nowakowskiella sp. JEL0078]
VLQSDSVNVEVDEENRLPIKYNYEDEPILGFRFSYQDEIIAKNSYWAKVMNPTYKVSYYDFIKDTGPGEIDIVVIAPSDPALLS